jgi:recombination protein RecA
MYGEGISREGDLLDLAVEKEVVEKSGAWFSFDRERIGQGRENSKTFLKEHPEISKAIEEKLLQRFGLSKKQKETPAS